APDGDDPRVLATWMRRGNSWYCAFGAALCLNVPIVAMSSDLPDQAAEHQRNAEILAAHRPLVLIVDDTADLEKFRDLLSGTLVVSFRDLWAEAKEAQKQSIIKAACPESSDAVLCYCYTGGTTRASRRE
ncbi:unnamed protein product, partial [Polarella glacialis]